MTEDDELEIQRARTSMKEQSISRMWQTWAPPLSADKGWKARSCNLERELAMAEGKIMDGFINYWLTVETQVWHTVEKAITAPGMYQTAEER